MKYRGAPLNRKQQIKFAFAAIGIALGLTLIGMAPIIVYNAIGGYYGRLL